MTTSQFSLPRTSVECGEYLIRALVNDELVAYAIRNLWGWDVLRRISPRRYIAIRTSSRAVAAGLLHHYVAQRSH